MLIDAPKIERDIVADNDRVTPKKKPDGLTPPVF
jgi:hypothetical protein